MAKPRHSRFPPRKSSPSVLIPAVLLTFTLVALILLALGILSFPGSSGGSRRANDLSTIMKNAAGRSRGDDERGEEEKWVEVISWKPRASIYHNFLSKEECEFAKPHMQESTVVDSATGRRKNSRARTSCGTSLTSGGDKIIRDIENRIADFMLIPVEHGEGLHVLHYEVGQKYEPHHDYFTDEYSTKNGGQRIATVLMYLSDVEEGGETLFPTAKSTNAVPWWDKLSDCAKKGLPVSPNRVMRCFSGAYLEMGIQYQRFAPPRGVHVPSFPSLIRQKRS